MMRRRATKADRTVPVALTIYALIDPHTRETYIGKYKTERLRTAYMRHLALEYSETANMCEDIQEFGALPKFFVLEEIVATKVEAYGYQLAWIKYFAEHDYWRSVEDATAYYARHLNAKNQALYNAIAEKPFDKVYCSAAQRFDGCKLDLESKQSRKPAANLICD